ncbi:MAG: hypothetical protein HFH80_00425 [Lachnospiraceae bacterium]|nr:hypothetical protein [Lachnospiraceae bacterium]
MKKIGKALALGDMLLCLALAGAYGYIHGVGGELKWAQTTTVDEAEGPEEPMEIRRIALTFDDEVIIGLSQEICCISDFIDLVLFSL